MCIIKNCTNITRRFKFSKLLKTSERPFVGCVVVVNSWIVERDRVLSQIFFQDVFYNFCCDLLNMKC